MHKYVESTAEFVESRQRDRSLVRDSNTYKLLRCNRQIEYNGLFYNVATHYVIMKIVIMNPLLC